VRILLDTHVLLWALGKSSKLNATVRAALESSDNEVLFSAASIWEVAIKASLGRVDFSVSPEDIVRSALASGFVELPVTSAAALKVAALPLHHRDPFDRLLVAQALTQPAALYTADGQLGVYSELVVDVR
jgi:PIN domain nuclease of toxin-antitoxin system